MARRPSAQEVITSVDRLAFSGPVNLREFRAAVLDVLRRAFGFDWYVWVLTDPVSEVGVDPLAVAPDLGQLPELVRLKYLTEVNRWTQLNAVGALGGNAERSPLWSRAQHRHGVVDVISAVFRDDFGCWAFLDLWLDRHASAAELDLLACLLPALTGALRHRQASTFSDVAEPPASAAGAAVVVLDDLLRVTGLTPASQSWLARLLPPTSRPDPVPAAAFNVAAQLLAREAGLDGHPAEARVHVSRGLWITLKAARLQPGGLIAVTLEPSTPAERLDLFARSHALSARERELLSVLAQGADTRQIADRMFLSEHTVQDHLKSIFAKTDAHSRRTLLSHALGVKTD